MLISSLADVSNHLRNPLSLQYSSIWLALFTNPSFAWSHCQTQKKIRPCHWLKRPGSGQEFLFESPHFKDDLVFYFINPLSPNIHVQILQTDLHTFP